LCLLSNLTSSGVDSAPDGAEAGKDANGDAAGTRWIIGGQGRSVKPANHEFCGDSR